MNKSFKVVFSKARSALMVVNEVTSSVQAKGTKTVVATAVAAMIAGVAGVAQADETRINGEVDKIEVSTGKTASVSGAATVTDVFDIAKTGILSATAGTGDSLTIKAAGAKNAGTIGDKDTLFGKIVVAAGMTNTGYVYAKELTIDADYSTGMFSKDNGHTKFETINLNKGTFTIVDFATAEGAAAAVQANYNKAKNGGTNVVPDNQVKVPEGMLVFADGTVNFNGGQIAYGDKPVSIAVLGTKNGEAINFTKGTYTFGDVEVYGKANATIGSDTVNAPLSIKIDNLTLANAAGGNTIKKGTLEIGAATVKSNLTINDGDITVGALDVAGTVGVSGGEVAVTTTKIGASGGTSASVTVTGVKTVVDLGEVTLGYTVKGEGEMTTAYNGSVTVSDGEMTAKTVAIASGSKLQISGGKASLGEVTLAEVTLAEATSAESKASLDVSGGTAIEALSVAKYRKASVIGTGNTIGTLTVAKDGEATIVAKAGTVSNEGRLAIGGTVKSLTNTKDGTVTLNEGGAVDLTITNDFSNAGTITLASGNAVDLQLAAKATNAGNITGVNNTNTYGALKISGNELVNTGTITVDTITIGKNGKLTTDVAFGDELGDTWAAYKTITVEKDGVYNANALNGLFKTGAAADPADTDAAQKADALVLPQGKLVLKGGSVTVNNVAPAKVVVLDEASIDIESGDYSVGSLKTVGENLAIDVKGGSLSVTDALHTANRANVQVAAAASLNITASSIGLKANEDGQLLTTLATTDYSGVTNAGTVVVSGLDGKSVKATDLDTVKDLVAPINTGLVNLGKLTVTNFAENVYDSTKDTITADGAVQLAGVEVDQFKNTTVTKVADHTAPAGSFGAIEMVSGASTNTASVATDTVLKLNNSGKIVAQYGGEKVGNLAVEGTLITTGANAEIGALTGNAGKVAVEAGSLTVNGESSIKTLDVDGALTMGTAARAPGATTDSDPYKLTVTDKITVAGTLTALGEVDVKGGSIAGTANLGKLKVNTGDLSVTGNAQVAEIVTGTTGKILVGDEVKAGSLTVEKMTAGTIFADPAWVDGVYNPSRVVVAEMAGGSVEAGRNSIAVIGSTADVAEAAVANAGFRIEKVLTDVTTGKQTNIGAVNSVAYVAGVVAEGEDYAAPISANIAATDRTLETYTTAVNTLTVNSGSLLYVDMANFDRYGDAAVFGTYTTPVVAGTVFLGNVANGDVYNLGASVGAVSRLEDHVFFTGDMLMQPKVAANKLSVTMLTVEELEAESEGITDVVGFDAAYAYFKERANLNNTSKSARFNNWLWSEATTNAAGINTVAQLGQIADDVASIAGTAGMVNVTMDALSQFNDTVSARTSILARNGEGVNVWADVNGGKFEGKKVIAGAGYSSDIYAGVLGVDTTVACGAKIGAALTIGTADTDSKNTSAVTSMDSDLVGFSVYTSKTFGDIWNVAADIGYIQASNEVTTKAYNLGKFDADSNAFTFGIRGEVLTKAGALDIVPHAGLRYTRVDVDGFEAGFVTDYEAMNVFQLPVGVTVSGELEVAGWNVAPAFDLTFVPTWGDKNADLTLGINGASVKEAGTLRVLDSNVVNATLGVAAQNGAWTFGLDYKLGVGSDDRMNNTFNVNVRYAF